MHLAGPAFNWPRWRIVSWTSEEMKYNLSVPVGEAAAQRRRREFVNDVFCFLSAVIFLQLFAGEKQSKEEKTKPRLQRFVVHRLGCCAIIVTSQMSRF